MVCLFRLRAEGYTYVAVMGDFNRWSTTNHPMTRVDGRWEMTIDLLPGVHAYDYFCIDFLSDGTMRSVIEPGRAALIVPGEPPDRQRLGLRVHAAKQDAIPPTQSEGNTTLLN